MNSQLIVATVAVLLAACHRATVLWIYRSWFRQGFAGDAAFHFAVTRRIARTGRYDGIPEFLIRDEDDTYPILFHRYAAMFSSRTIERYQYLPNAILFVFFTAALTLYVQYVANSLLDLGGDHLWLYFLLFFLTLASNLSLDMNGLNYISLSERQLSRFCCASYFLMMTIFLTFGDALSLVGAMFFGALTLISSMFGRQSVFFITPAVSIVLLSPWPLLLLAGAILGAAIVDGRYFIRGLVQMCRFSHAYRHHTKNSRYYRLALSRFIDLKTVFGLKGGVRSRLREIEHNEPSKLLFRHPELIMIFAGAAFKAGELSSAELALLAATLGVYLATSTEALRHYGEASRYIEFALWLLPAFILARFAVAGLAWQMWTAYGIWVMSLVVRKYGDWSKLQFPSRDELSDFLSMVPVGPDATLYTVPFSLGGSAHVRTGCRALMYQGSAVTLSLYHRYMEEIPFLKRDWSGLAIEHHVSHIICERAYLELTKPLLGWEYDFPARQKVAESDRFVAYRLR